MVYRGRRLWVPRTWLLCLPACAIAYTLIHYHTLQYIMIGSRGIAPEMMASGLQHELCATLLRPRASVPVPAANTDKTKHYSCNHQDDIRDSARRETMLDRLPQWFPPEPVQNEVQHLLLAPIILPLDTWHDLPAPSR